MMRLGWAECAQFVGLVCGGVCVAWLLGEMLGTAAASVRVCVPIPPPPLLPPNPTTYTRHH